MRRERLVPGVLRPVEAGLQFPAFLVESVRVLVELLHVALHPLRPLLRALRGAFADRFQHLLQEARLLHLLTLPFRLLVFGVVWLLVVQRRAGEQRSLVSDRVREEESRGNSLHCDNKNYLR